MVKGYVVSTGHGLDWVWPFSLAYPQEQIAIINDICVIHPKKELQPGTKLTIYQEHNPHAELVAVLAKFGYEAEVCTSLILCPMLVAVHACCCTTAGRTEMKYMPKAAYAPRGCLP